MTTATTDHSPLSLHDALPISSRKGGGERAVPAGPKGENRSGDGRRAARGPQEGAAQAVQGRWSARARASEDRKSTRLNSSHANISYAVFCLKKKNNTKYDMQR